jgi:hypothetical protein
VTQAPSTVTEALDLLAAEGYTEDFNLPAKPACSGCGTAIDLRDSVIERQFRFEGASNPADAAIVLGLHCAACGARGVFVSAYGPDADPELLAQLRWPDR